MWQKVQNQENVHQTRSHLVLYQNLYLEDYYTPILNNNCCGQCFELAYGGPRCWQVEHIGACPLCNCFDVVSCNTVLVLCPNTTKRVILLLSCTMFFEFHQSKNTIVGVIFFYVETFVQRHCFQTKCTSNCLQGCVWILKKVEYYSACMIKKQTSTSVAIVFFA